MRQVNKDQRVRVSCTVNGVKRLGYAEPRTLLSDFLRHELGLYGTHVGCEHGVCGACTIIMDGLLARSCSTLAVQTEGSEITTVEGLSEDVNLDLLRELFSKNGALQCGFCSAGILASTKHFLNQHPNPTEDEIKDMLTGHICRCTGYAGMVKAIQEFVDWSPERAKK
ncbi:MAG: (2Fe-2S)-binding protein [Pseudomonadota bacterium]|nr:(2Fe-2S)-binding protein [Rhodospirillaceae bacterium]MEC7146537.1 (2Fe-2S)-binding protein [Pseudomonadota bacterium]MEC7387966.1 (2Fe-2S)-binding protein [Pseudomonadota bacterium]MEC7441161.1 (2Fe-2S)-binding protein [Pseudomonadota bacterium]MEC7659777.1 (2Fe-2S)-binding protein [Pseudomonadota bacterium]